MEAAATYLRKAKSHGVKAWTKKKTTLFCHPSEVFSGFFLEGSQEKGMSKSKKILNSTPLGQRVEMLSADKKWHSPSSKTSCVSSPDVAGRADAKAVPAIAGRLSKSRG